VAEVDGCDQAPGATLNTGYANNSCIRYLGGWTMIRALLFAAAITDDSAEPQRTRLVRS
jgi:hypothetical protein